MPVADMLETYPADLGGIGREALVNCIHECKACGQACTACADACLSESDNALLMLRKCVRTNLDCADICDTTARVLSRHTGYDANITKTILEACITACRSCGEECGRHGSDHDHCRICADACHRCERACAELLGALG